jgi:regulator of sirC expression with transglutaminase-like and TPR domain
MFARIATAMIHRKDPWLKLEQPAARIGNRAPHPWVTLEAAIILRKLKDQPGEIAVIERYLQHRPPGHADAKITERLDTIRPERTGAAIGSSNSPRQSQRRAIALPLTAVTASSSSA